jgi:hypothetical protein
MACESMKRNTILMGEEITTEGTTTLGPEAKIRFHVIIF